MNRQQWKDLLEGIGFLALIASLVFVGLETRNSSNQTILNTQAMEISAYQELTNNISTMNAIAIQDESAATIMANVYEWPSPAEWQTFSAMIMIFRHGDMAFFMYEKGVIDEDRLRSTLQPLPLRFESGRAYWKRISFFFVDSYQSYVNSLIEEGFWTPPTDAE